MSDNSLGSTFDPLASDKKSEPLPSDLVPRMAARALKTGSHDLTFLRVILDSAIAHNMTSPKEIGKELGQKAGQVAKGKANPDPVTHRAVLNFVAHLEA